MARYRTQLLRYCQRLLSASRAEDAVQQTFLSAYESIRGDSESRRLRPWLYRIAHNVAIDVLRKDGRVQGELREDHGCAEPSDQVAEGREELRALITALGALPARQRDAILMRELEGRSYSEIATALGVSGGAVRQLLNRARNALRAPVAPVAYRRSFASGSAGQARRRQPPLRSRAPHRRGGRRSRPPA